MGPRLSETPMRQIISSLLPFVLLTLPLAAGEAIPATQPKPVPRLQAIPQPYDQVSFERDGVEICRYHFGRALQRPFIFPVIGPAGRSLTRMGHPHDPFTHSHHNSVWISHQNVNGVNFWEDRGKGRIVHQRVEQFEDEGDRSWMTSLNAWVDEGTNKTLMQERRRTMVQLQDAGQYLLVIDMQFQALKEPIVLGKTSFGPIGVRMAKTIGTNDGGGMIRNSEGGVNEKEIFWKKAKWVDYSGAITNQAIEGITLMDHPSNPNHPAGFHVRGDGWMGASLTLDEPLTIPVGKPLMLRYGLWIHSGRPALDDINRQWSAFAAAPIAAMGEKK